MDQETPAEASNDLGKHREAAYWFVLRCPERTWNHWSVCNAVTCRKQKAAWLLAVVENELGRKFHTLP